MALVRVRTKGGGEANLGEEMAKAAGLKILDAPTHGDDGRLRPPYPPKPKTSAKSAAKNDTTTSKEDKS